MGGNFSQAGTSLTSTNEKNETTVESTEQRGQRPFSGTRLFPPDRGSAAEVKKDLGWLWTDKERFRVPLPVPQAGKNTTTGPMPAMGKEPVSGLGGDPFRPLPAHQARARRPTLNRENAARLVRRGPRKGSFFLAADGCGK